jgi:hypothetical protein
MDEVMDEERSQSMNQSFVAFIFPASWRRKRCVLAESADYPEVNYRKSAFLRTSLAPSDCLTFCGCLLNEGIGCDKGHRGHAGLDPGVLASQNCLGTLECFAAE